VPVLYQQGGVYNFTKGNRMVGRRTTSIYFTVEEAYPHARELGPDHFVVQLGADEGSTLGGVPALPPGLVGATLVLDYQGRDPGLKRGDQVVVTGDLLPVMQASTQEGKVQV
jgi:hypothetical protein